MTAFDQPGIGDVVHFLVRDQPEGGVSVRAAQVVGIRSGTAGDVILDLQVFTRGETHEVSASFTLDERRRGLAFRGDVSQGDAVGCWRPILPDVDLGVSLYAPAVLEMVCDSVTFGGGGGDVALTAQRGGEGQPVDGYARLAIRDPGMIALFVAGGRYRVTIEAIDPADGSVLGRAFDDA